MTTLTRGAITIILGGGVAIAGFAAYKWSGARQKRLSLEQISIANPITISSVPPFSTKEPNRYQATRIITTGDGDSSTAPPSVARVTIVHDGDRRREDYDSDSDFPTSYLEIPAGTFILLPAKKVYADINSASPDLPGISQPQSQQSDGDADFSPERLLNQAPALARYEKLGVEKLDGHETTKYRVSSVASTTGTASPTSTLIWIDETLGMPIRSETDSADGNRRAKLIIELRDIKLQVDPKVFELPGDYKLIGYAEFLEQWRQRATPSRQDASSKP